MEYEENLEFKIRVFNFEGGKMNITIVRSIEDLHGNPIREYKNITCEATRDKNCVENKPTLNPGVYLLKVFISPHCDDKDLENNQVSKLIVILPEPLDQDYTKLRISEFLPDPDGDDSDEMPNGEWVELYNTGDSIINLEGLIINDDYGNGLEISQTNVLQNTTNIQPNSYLTIYRNKDGKLTLNNEGLSKVQLFYEDLLLDEVSYSSSTEDISWSKVNDIWIRTIPTPNQENKREEPDYSSHLTIDQIYLGGDDKAAFGDSLRVRITIYKGDTNKYNLDLYIVDENNNQVSKRSELNIEDKFMNYTLIIPIQLDPNCNTKYPNGTYTVVLKGLDKKETKEIEIKGITKSLCEIIKIKEEISPKKTLESSDIQAVELQEETSMKPITSSVIYQSSDIKARNMGIYFFCAVLLLLIIYLIFKKTL